MKDTCNETDIWISTEILIFFPVSMIGFSVMYRVHEHPFSIANEVDSQIEARDLQGTPQNMEEYFLLNTNGKLSFPWFSLRFLVLP